MRNSIQRPDATSKVLSGSLWMIGMRWSIRLSGLVSTVILARLLVPADFGIIAMAKIAMGLLEAISTVGVDLAIIRHQNPSRKDYDTAWTIRLIQRLVLASVLFFCAPLFANYFSEPRTVGVVRLLALATLARGLLNIGIVDFRKTLNFRQEFRYGVCEKFSSVAITIGLAFYLRSYWALALAIPIEALIGLILSYTMHPYRPRFSLEKFWSIWSFSMWLLISRIGYFFNARMDQILVGGNFDTSSMGYYNFAADLGELPGNEMAVPMRRAIFPNLATMLSDPKKFDRTILNTVGLAALVLIPVGFGLAAISELLFPLVFGPRWEPAIPLFQWLAIAGVFSGLSAILEIPLLVNGKEKLSAAESWLRALALLTAISFLLRYESLEFISEARMVIGFLFFIVMIRFCTAACGLAMSDIFRAVWRSFFASIVMFLIVSSVDLTLIGASILELAGRIMLGIITYVFIIFVLWILGGRPDGPEKTLWNHIAGSKRWRT